MATTAPSPRHRARRALAPLLEIPPIVEVDPGERPCIRVLT